MSIHFDLLMNLANVLYLFSFMVRDILWLRGLAVIAAACLIPYFYFRPEPLLTPIYWNLVFAALNIYWICRLLLERRPVKLSTEEQRLCELVFRTMTPREMIKLLKLATWENAEAGECFVERGKPLDRLMVIYSGKACAEVDGRNVTELQPGHFIGSISYVTEEGGTGQYRSDRADALYFLAQIETQGLHEQEPRLALGAQIDARH
jgi:Popeye protein conserved region